jgi:hypothetical protein
MYRRASLSQLAQRDNKKRKKHHEQSECATSDDWQQAAKASERRVHVRINRDLTALTTRELSGEGCKSLFISKWRRSQHGNGAPMEMLVIATQDI